MKLVSVLAFLTLTACQSKKFPEWHGKIYSGDNGFIVRKQENEVISTASPEFNQFICIEGIQFQCLLETYVTNASGWERQSACGLENR